MKNYKEREGMDGWMRNIELSDLFLKRTDKKESSAQIWAWFV